MDSPYREPPSVAPAVAPSRDGPVRVEVGAHGVRVDLGARFRLAVSGGRAVWTRIRRGRRRTLSLGRARLWVTRGHPTRELALWYEGEPGRVERLGAVRPVPLFDTGAVAAWRSLFRERPRRALEVCRDGTIVMPARDDDRHARFYTRFGVSVSGDRVVFTDRDECRVATLLLPWIAPEDRQELARRFADLVDPLPPEPAGEGRSMPIRPWASGLGRASPIAALLPGPLPLSALSRFRR
ncbi:MAG TPA: hypothetical protein VIG06_25075 [Kofleriaceae bacterium]